MNDPKKIYHLRFIAVAVLGLNLAGCADAGQRSGLSTPPPVHELHRHEDDKNHHDDEILVLDPPPGYEATLKELGLSIIDVTHLDGMDSKLYHLKIDSGAHPFHARHHHDEKHPEVIVDVHHHFERHAKKYKSKRPKNLSRRAAKWGKAKPHCGKGIRIGIVDSGLDIKNPAFNGMNIVYRSFHPKNKRKAKLVHGTAVASVIVGTSKWGSLLPGAHLSAANVFHINKKGKSRASAKSILKAINWLINQKVHVINFSLAGPINRLVKKAIQHADRQGIVMVAAAGNNGPFTKKKSYPAAYIPVIAIAASDGAGTVARFSSAGSYVEFAAPGVKLWTAVPGGGKAMSGTSYASPLVAGYVAAMINYKGIKHRELIRREFRKIAKARGKKKWDKYSGWGFIGIKPPC